MFKQSQKKKLSKFQGRAVLKGREDDLEYLIYHSDDEKEGEIVVFVDVELDVDWEVDGAISALLDQDPLRGSLAKTLVEIAILEPMAHNWPSDLKLTSKRLLGEALACVLRKDIPGSEVAIANAHKYMHSKSRQVSRFWILQSCFVAGVIALLACLISILAKQCLVDWLGHTPYAMMLCFWIGCVGALLFVVMRFGKTPRVDSTAEKHLHHLEGLARIVGGGIAGILAGSMVKLGLIFPLFSHVNKEMVAMCAIAMIAGASERLAAGIVTKVENGENTKKEE